MLKLLQLEEEEFDKCQKKIQHLDRQKRAEMSIKDLQGVCATLEKFEDFEKCLHYAMFGVALCKDNSPQRREFLVFVAY